ncbi:helix-turn-helix domain-containing protein [Luteipulveratus sp. YIM 133132]|uniref:AraC family transcriptional regulator n=1 Tax=Luteipulveratus flavus TaxID=3031728 RepID=UPI0023B053C3|nr:helix-turn-helix domain-containing protein [Luteipulveratus sp. YIM 133132]MDE9367816.1 helix-turn-helix domain-containing protein [Luteipulveratus sp. YIM 133132]
MASWTNATSTRPRHVGPYGRGDGLGEIVHPQRTDQVLQRGRLEVTSPALAAYADRFWTVRWRRYGAPLEFSEVITNPVCHLTFEDGRRPDGGPLVRHGIELPAAVLTTVWTDRFRVRLEGEARVIGVRFRPGAMAAIAGRPLAADQSLTVDDVLTGARAVLREVLAEPSDEGRRAIVQDWLEPQLPTPASDYLTAAALVDEIRLDASIVRVDQIGSSAGLSVRSVQRLFRRYIGVTPKWVLARCRLQDAAAFLDADPSTDLADVAARLGWYDQSHFVRDFRRFLGVTPGQYARDAQAR